MRLTSPTPPREPHLLRFGLRKMFLAVTGASVLCALLVLTEGAWPLVIVVAASLVAAHVFGTLVGTRLRDTSHEMVLWRVANPAIDDDVPQAEAKPSASRRAALPPPTPLANHGSVSRWPLWFVIAGAVLGLAIGGATIAMLAGPQLSWPGWAVGTLSCGVLGTWAAFLGSSVTTIARHAWRHAQED